MIHRPLNRRAILAVLILFGISRSGAILRAAEPGFYSGRMAQSSRAQYVAIMGEVVRPGVFEVADPQPELVDLVGLAGGPSPQASGNVRVIRRGRGGQQTFLSPGLKYTLLPGDLVILDAKPSRSDRRFAGISHRDSTPRGTGRIPETNDSAIVQIGLVQLIDRPIVLDVPAGYATLNGVLSMLRHPVSETGEVTILKSGSGTQIVTVNQSTPVPLGSGTVLVFNPATVNAQVLPHMPPIVRPAARNARSVAETPSERPAALADTPDPRRPDLSRDPERAPLLTPREIKPAASLADDAAALPDSVIDPPAKPLEAVREVAPGISAASRGQFEQQETVEANIGLTGASEAEPSPAGSGLWQVGLVLAAGVFLVGGMFMFVSRDLTRARVANVEPIVAPRPELPKTFLEALVANTLPLVEEALSLPDRGEIFGRPKLDSPYRIDSAHASLAPHFVPEPLRPAPSPAVARVREKSAAVGRGQIARPDNAHSSTVGVLDRALATFEGGRR